MDKNKLDTISRNFETILNSHGHAYQYSIARKVEELKQTGDGVLWDVEGTEVPVTSRGNVTHVDLVCSILFDSKGDYNRYFLVAECKRADPAKANWCFARTPVTWGNHTGDYIQFDSIQKSPGENRFVAQIANSTTKIPIMGLGIDTRTGEPGSGVGANDRSPINAAVTQVLRGVGGYISHLGNGGSVTRPLDDQLYIVIPAIFTTANLFVTDSKISNADLQTGNLPKGSIKAERVDWIWYNYNRSAQLAHELQMAEATPQEYSNYFKEFTRTIAIVSPSGIESFLRNSFRHMR